MPGQGNPSAGTATLSLVPDPANGRMQIVYTGATVGERITRDGSPVRYPPITSTHGVIYDYEAQPGVAHTWGVSGGTVTGTLPSPVGCDGAFLVHPTDPGLTLKVKVRDDNPNRWTTPGTLHEVMGQRNPVWTHTVRTYHSGQVVFWTPYAQEQAVIDLFASGGPVLLNPPDCCPLRRVWMAIPDLVREKIDVGGKSGIWWTLDYTRVGEPGGYITRPGQVANTYGSVLADTTCHPDYASFLTGGCHHADYADLLTTPHPHGAKP